MTRKPISFVLDEEAYWKMPPSLSNAYQFVGSVKPKHESLPYIPLFPGLHHRFFNLHDVNIHAFDEDSDEEGESERSAAMKKKDAANEKRILIEACRRIDEANATIAKKKLQRRRKLKVDDGDEWFFLGFEAENDLSSDLDDADEWFFMSTPARDGPIPTIDDADEWFFIPTVAQTYPDSNLDDADKSLFTPPEAQKCLISKLKDANEWFSMPTSRERRQKSAAKKRECRKAPYDFKEMTFEEDLAAAKKFYRNEKPSTPEITQSNKTVSPRLDEKVQESPEKPVGSLKGALFVAIDSEAGHGPKCPPTELGIAMLDTRDLNNKNPLSNNLITMQHYLIIGRRQKHKEFEFGTSNKVTEAEATEILKSIFQTVDRDFFLIGHNLSLELQVMKNLGIELKKSLKVIDTYLLAQVELKGRRFDLKSVIEELGITNVETYHNAGNDATNSLRVMMLLSGVARERGLEEYFKTLSMQTRTSKP